MARLRSGEADLALIDLDSLVDAVAHEPDFGARCVFVVTQRLPMAAFYVVGRPASGGPVETVEDLTRARYAAQPGSALAARHRALLRRLDADPDELAIEMPYNQMFGALASGVVDVLPDFAALSTRVRRALRPDQQVGILRYRNCGVRAYGVGLVASGRALGNHRAELGVAVAVASDAYRGMRRDADATIQAASAIHMFDHDHTLTEWIEEEQAVVFGYEAVKAQVGASNPDMWSDTVAWRREVAGLPRTPDPEELFEALI